MAHVLLSSADRDADLAERVGRWLSAEGHSVVFQGAPLQDAPAADLGLDLDSDDPGTDGDESGGEPGGGASGGAQSLSDALHRADLLLCIVSPAFATSARCTALAGMAAWAGVAVFALRVGDAENPLPAPWPLSGAVDLDGEVVVESEAVVEPAGDRSDPDDPDDSGGEREAVRDDDPATVRDAVVASLRRWDASGRWTRGDPPYPGLRPFDPGMARVFFGRSDDSRKLVERLRAPAGPDGSGLTVVVGPSGSGKSSLVRAGALPLLDADPAWLVCPPLTPGVDPCAVLGQVLTHVARGRGVPWTRDYIETALTEPDGLARLAKELLAEGAGPAQRMLLVVDQAEELFTRTPPAVRDRFVAQLAAAAPGPVRAVATIRSEFLDDLLAAAGEADLPVTPFAVTALRPEALRSVVTGPARVAGIQVSGPLVDRLVAETGSGRALPLLAFVLEQLASGVDRGGELSEQRYDQLGGVSGALAAQADAALAAAQARTGRGRADVLEGLLRLVTVDDAGNSTRRTVPLAEMPEAVRVELGEFVERRLLTVEDGPEEAVVTVSHERVLTAWPPLVETISQHTEMLRLRRTVETAAAEWQRRGRPADHLWPLGRATTARDVLESAELTPDVRAFLAASRSQGRRRRQQLIAVLAVLSVAMTVVAAFASVQARSATREKNAADAARQRAIAGELLARADSVRTSDPRTAFRLAAAAQKISPGPRTQSVLMDLLVNTGVDASLRHGGGGLSVVFSPDGSTLASGSEDGSVVLWDVSERGAARRLGDPLAAGHGDRVVSVVFSPDGSTLASGSYDGSVVLWDVSEPGAPRRLGEPLAGHGGWVWSVVFSPDGSTLASGSEDGSVVLWDVSGPGAPRRLGEPLAGHGDRVRSVVFSPDGWTLASGSGDGSVVLWDLSERGAPRRLGEPLAGHGGGVWSVVFSPDGWTLASGSGDGSVVLWDLSERGAPRRLGEPLAGHGDRVWSVVFSPDGSTLASGTEVGTVVLWDVSGRGAARRLGDPLAGHGGLVSVVFSPDGSTLASGSDDGSVVLWDLSERGAPRRLGEPLAGHGGWVWSVVFSPDGSTLASGSYDGSVVLWDVSGPGAPRRLGEPLAGHDGGVRSVVFSPDGSTLASGSYDGSVVLWDVSGPGAPRRLGEPLAGHGGWVWSVVFSPDGSMLASGSYDGSVVLWDVSGPGAPRRLGEPLAAGHDGGVVSVVFSPDGSTLASGSEDGSVVLWDLSERGAPRRLGEPLAGHGGWVWSVVFSPDGSTLASGSDDGSVVLWDVSEPGAPRRLGEPLAGHDGGVVSVVFSPDGSTLASGSYDGTVVLWDVSEPGAPRRLGEPLAGHGGGVRSVVFSPDGSTLASGIGDGSVVLWDMSELQRLRADLVGEACRRAGGLTEDEWTRYVPDLPFQRVCP